MDYSASSGALDKKKAAILGLSALGSILVSYLVYKRVVDDDKGPTTPEKQRKAKRALMRNGQYSRSRQSSNKASSSPANRIVGASHRLR